MANKKMSRTEETIDLLELAQVLLRKAWLIVIVSIVFGAVGYVYTVKCVTPTYQASAMMIVNSGDYEYANYVTSDQLRSASSLVDVYSIIVTSTPVMNQVKENLDMESTFSSVVKGINVTAVNETQVMKITVTATSPSIAQQVCEEITKVVPEAIIEAVEAGSVKLIAPAEAQPSKVAPNEKKIALEYAMVGFVLVCGIIVLFTILDNKVKKEEDVLQLGMTVLGVIPSCVGEVDLC